MNIDEIPRYIKEAEKIRDKYHPQINVKIGFELDYIPGQEHFLKSLLKKYYPRLDYIIAGVHTLRLNGVHYGIFEEELSTMYKTHPEIELFYYQNI